MNNTLSTASPSNFRCPAFLIHLLMFLLPFLALISSFGVGLCSFAFLLTALLSWRAGQEALARAWRQQPPLRWVLWSFALSLALPLATFALGSGLRLRDLEKPVRMLAAASVMLTVLVYRPQRKALWWGLIAGAAAGAVFAAYQRWGMGMERPGGLINSITFGDIVLCMGLLCMAGALDFRGRQQLWPALGAVAGLIGSIATGTRGSWFAIGLAAIVFVKYGHVLRGRFRKALVVLALALLGAAWFVPQTGMRERVAQGVSDVHNYLSGGNTYTNVGVRFEMWTAASLLIEQHPWRGASPAEVKAEMKQLVAQGKAPAFVLEFEHFHNEILQVLVYGGAFGLLAWLLTVLTPLLFFRRVLNDARMAAAQAPALAGMLLVLSYFSFGLTEVIFWSVHSTMFYALMLFLLIGLCLTAQQSTPKEVA